MDIGRLGRRCVGKSPADIMNITKEAGLIATRNKRTKVEYKDITEALERIDLGIAHPLSMSEKERETTAYHESGHLLALYTLHPTDDVFKASIIHRGGALGVVYHSPREEQHTSNRDRMLADIKVSLGGYMGEKIKYGVTSNGVSSDFAHAMSLAHTMVWRLGMGRNGFVGDYTMIPESQLSESIKEKLNAETYEIFNGCAKDVEEFLRAEWTWWIGSPKNSLNETNWSLMTFMPSLPNSEKPATRYPLKRSWQTLRLLLLTLPALSACGPVTFPADRLPEAVRELCLKEQKLEVDARLLGKTLALSCDLEGLIGLDLDFRKGSAGNVGRRDALGNPGVLVHRRRG
jgi:hypothetical protein